MLVQNLIVAILVILAAVYATWLLAPARARLRAAQWLLAKLPAHEGKDSMLRRAVLRLEERANNACAGCGTGGSKPGRR